MTVRLLAAILGLLVLGALLARDTGKGAAWAPFPPAPHPRIRAPRPAVPHTPAPPRLPTRNLFQYADDAAAVAPAPAPTLRPFLPLPAPAPTPAPVRVVGLIRRGGHARVALVVQGEMTIVGKGERAGGYTVLEIDEETGVRLRAPDGGEVVLPPPRF